MPDRSVAPPLAPLYFKDLPAPQVESLPEGGTVYLFAGGQQPVFKVELLAPRGSAASANPALATLHAEMLREGSRNLPAEELNNKLDFYGAFLNISAGLEHTFVNLYGRSEFLPHVLPLLKEIVNHPEFPEKALERQKKKLIQELLISQQKTSYWAPRLLRRSVFGSTHPYSRILTSDYYQQITRQDLLEYHQAFRNSLQKILVAGSFPGHITDSLRGLTAPVIAEKPSVLQDVSISESTPFTEKKLPRTSQASIALGRPILSISENSYPLQAFTIKIAGGYFGSRLMKRLREEEGLTYGIYAHPVHLRHGSYLQIAADVKKNEADRSIEICRAELEKLYKESVSSEELDTVKNFALGEYLNEANTVFDFAELYKTILLHKLPDDFYAEFYNKLMQISEANIKHAARELFAPEKLLAVKVW